ncbi:MAG: DUF1080 domain-containing protein [Verrucomicrobiota bacterium]
MIKTTFLTFISLLTASVLQAAEPIQLFNGNDIEGWTKKGGNATYEVIDGVIIGTTAKDNSPNTFLCPPNKYGNFELTFEVNCDTDLNSGVQVRSQDNPSDLPDSLDEKSKKKAIGRTKSGSLCGPQVEIAAKPKAGSVYFEGVGGWILLSDEKLALKSYKKDAWNSYKVRAVDSNIQVWINGEKVTDGEDTMSGFKEGYIGLQVHRIKPGTGPFQVRFRNITITEL